MNCFLESFGQIEEKKQKKNKHGDENTDMQLEMLQLQAITIEKFLGWASLYIEYDFIWIINVKKKCAWIIDFKII